MALKAKTSSANKKHANAEDRSDRFNTAPKLSKELEAQRKRAEIKQKLAEAEAAKKDVK